MEYYISSSRGQRSLHKYVYFSSVVVVFYFLIFFFLFNYSVGDPQIESDLLFGRMHSAFEALTLTLFCYSSELPAARGSPNKCIWDMARQGKEEKIGVGIYLKLSFSLTAVDMITVIKIEIYFYWVSLSMGTADWKYINSVEMFGGVAFRTFR